ncbi:glycosyltransferase family 2 protein [Brevibacillus ginsengisoli]|uniref:glycosyltransferase family 2 protein n=1 Tax=Brevibacillus ginsengisoli TaxID=363854 RepID=UPI003CEF674E
MPSHRKKKSPTIPDSIPISVIIPTENEEKTISKVIAEAQKISNNTEIIVVCNGVTDNTSEKAKKMGVNVLEYQTALGHDVGRAIGALISRGEILLFIDADFVVPCSTLREYCLEVIRGSDVVLNSYSGMGRHSIPEAKRALNLMLGRPDLKGSSFTSVPHALSRRAVEIIGYENLAVPPKAHVMAVLKRLKISRGKLVQTNRLNRIRKGRNISIKNLVLGDHVEAICELIEKKGGRGGFAGFRSQRFALNDVISTPHINQQHQEGETSNHEEETRSE